MTRFLDILLNVIMIFCNLIIGFLIFGLLQALIESGKIGEIAMIFNGFLIISPILLISATLRIHLSPKLGLDKKSRLIAISNLILSITYNLLMFTESIGFYVFFFVLSILNIIMLFADLIFIKRLLHFEN